MPTNYSLTPSVLMKFAKERHAGQVDKAGQPYYNHLLRVADYAFELAMNNISLKLNTTDILLIAFGHDLIEDTNTTASEIAALGISENVVSGIKRMTHKDDEDYFEDYIKRIAKDPYTIIVKMADLRDNMDITRLIGVRELDKRDLKRLNKYMKSYDYLNTILKNFQTKE